MEDNRFFQNTQSIGLSMLHSKRLSKFFEMKWFYRKSSFPIIFRTLTEKLLAFSQQTFSFVVRPAFNVSIRTFLGKIYFEKKVLL